MINSLIRSLCIAAFALMTHTATAQASSADTLSVQRSLFLLTRAQLQGGQTDAAAMGMTALRDYPLYPYLELLQLTRTLDRQSGVAIDDFLARHGDALNAEQLRNQWLAVLADNTRWGDYLRYYRATTASKQQQCWWLEALYRTDKNDSALTETGKLWLSTDMPDSCDAPFQRWLESTQRSEPLVWKRLLLALEQKQEALARALVVQIREPYKQQAEFALMLYRDPRMLGTLLPQVLQYQEASAVIALALKNDARRDADAATALWRQLVAEKQLTPEDSDAVRREIGRRQIIENDFAALPWLLRYDPDGKDSFLLEWRIRLALPDGDWARIERSIGQLPADMAQTPRWTYWLARALAQQRDDPLKQQRATEIFATLAKERGYYNFLAADLQESSYQLNDQRLTSTVALDDIAKLPGILRAREFLALDEPVNARREWQFTLRALPLNEQQNAALLTEQWGWHDQGIRTANQTGLTNDLHLRFPVGYRDAMNNAAKTTALPIQWLYAITRQESAFMADARSSAGALGLMQLMPATARQVARGQSMSITNDSLLQPAINIRLGSTYLNDMLQRYAGNRILATAAYNAGPSRISNLLKKQGAPLPADVWVEILPYKETREYVQNVLAFAVIYGARLGQPVALLQDNERKIGNGGTPLSANASCAPAPEKNC